jgi:hypothetical protein
MVPRCPCGCLFLRGGVSLSFRIRFLSSSTTSKSTSWERNARLVKDTNIKNNKYLDHIRESHDPALHLKTLEDEIRGTMGKALGKQGDKILSALRRMQQQRDEYDDLVHHQQVPVTAARVVECAQRHNEYRKEAITARWELVVHRQAVGMIVNNHKFVHDTFPIDEALPVHDGETSVEEKKTDTGKKKFGDQLEWWQSVGRWR